MNHYERLGQANIFVVRAALPSNNVNCRSSKSFTKPEIEFSTVNGAAEEGASRERRTGEGWTVGPKMRTKSRVRTKPRAY